MATEFITSIYNYVKISDAIATAGQPTPAQLTTIHQAGYEVMINLALPTSPNALPNEQELVEQLGMTYIAIPVEWENPTLTDVQQFFEVMQRWCDRPTFVHCAANMRVSAFIYLYRVLCQKVDPAIALADLQAIWNPNPTWQHLIDTAMQAHSN